VAVRSRCCDAGRERRLRVVGGEARIDAVGRSRERRCLKLDFERDDAGGKWKVGENVDLP
jgi:hypothetical protein